ncbi:MAG: cytochrome C [Gammaproteobacteria bacterium]|nr:MAG: cytochrome C [Gammaproteobacteria bacterium]
MNKINRRSFIKTTTAVAATSTMATFSPFAIGGATKKVVIVGGGIGGVTAAKYIKMLDSKVDVTVIEPNKNYYTCFMSNEVLSGHRSIDSIRFGYDGLKKRGVNIVHDAVNAIDAKGQVVKTAGGKSFAYDRCIVSPGIDFKWDTIGGYDANVAESIPHAYKAGPQTVTLRKQLESMKDGGVFLMCPPPNPFRCPPGPYERASQIASYFKAKKPKSKILILDPKDKFSKFGLFMDGWKRHYGYGTDNSIIKWVKGAEGGKIESVDPKTKTVQGEMDPFKADVINIIPAQKAGKIAFVAGLTNDKGWCPIEGKTFESKKHKNIHVIGDSAVASPMPKSGYAANSQAKVCAAAVVALLNGGKTPHPSYVNTCYSVIAPGDGISVAMVYDYKDGKIVKVKGSGGLTGKYDKKTRAREEQYAHSWFNNITNDIFG